MPELTREVRRAIDDERSRLGPQNGTEDQDTTANPDDLIGAVGEMPLGDDGVDVDGGLAGLEVFVELSLNGQNFTEDRVHFTYHGSFEPLRVRVVAPPEGATIPEEPTKAAKGAKKADDSHESPLVLPGSKISCEVANIVTTDCPALRADVFTKVVKKNLNYFGLSTFQPRLSWLHPRGHLHLLRTKRRERRITRRRLEPQLKC
jgi:hypothetical protein